MPSEKENQQTIYKKKPLIEMESFKQRHKRAVDRAIFLLECKPVCYRVIALNHPIFHIEAVRKNEIIKIRIVLDQILPEDVNMVREFSFPDVVTKEIWCKGFKSHDFDTKEIS